MRLADVRRASISALRRSDGAHIPALLSARLRSGPPIASYGMIDFATYEGPVIRTLP